MKSTRISEVFFLPFIFTLPKYCVGYVYHLPFSPNKGYTSKQTTTLKVSELHVPGYTQSKIPFILKDEHLQEANPDGTLTLRKLEEMRFGVDDFQSVIPHDGGHLVHKTKKAIFTQEECQQIVDEAEAVASRIEWTKNRHGNFPTTDLPLTELPETMKFLRVALVERLYPMLREQFGTYLPDPSKLRLADGFVVKYDALGGQKELKPHRDGSVVSFNIALNPASDFEGGGTWFASLDDAVKIDQGQVVSHSSALLHGGHGITAGKRYIMVSDHLLPTWKQRNGPCGPL